MKKLFGSFDVSWKFLIWFSVILGLGVGIINRIPFLFNTSFQDIAIVFDVWIVLAIFIIINTKSLKEATIKCFIFFLISQPLIYFSELLIDIFIHGKDFANTFTLLFKHYYIDAGWLTWTFLTIPGSMIAYQIKRNNILSAIALSVATMFLSFCGTNGLLATCFEHFPYHFINSVFDLIIAYYLIFIILSNKKERIISIFITTIGIVLGSMYFITNYTTPMNAGETFDFDQNTTIIDYSIDDENIANVLINENGKSITISSSKKPGTTTVTVIDLSGNEYNYNVTSTNKDFKIIQE